MNQKIKMNGEIFTPKKIVKKIFYSIIIWLAIINHSCII